LIKSLLVKNQGKASQIQSRNSNSSTEYSYLFSLMDNMPKGKENKHHHHHHWQGVTGGKYYP
jgi:predicted dithiol-disulfide oxidoreductase (DUF899 family)